jgi:hypothetical protein
VSGEASWDRPDAGFWDQEPVLRSDSRSAQSSSSTSESSSGNRGASQGRSRSRSVVPITSHEEFEEETGRQFWTIDEEWERLYGVLHGLSKRQALVKVYNRPVLHIVTPEIEAEQKDERLDRFQLSILENCPCAKPVDVVTAQIEERRHELALLTGRTETPRQKVRSFRE